MPNNKTDEDIRLAVLENIVTNLEKNVSSMDKKLDAVLIETVKFNTMISWGKGGLFVLAGVGAIVLFLWNQFKFLVLKAP